MKKNIVAIGEKVKKYWKLTDKYYKAEWVFLCIILAFSLFTMGYQDMVCTNFDAQRFLQWAFSDKFFRVSEIMAASPYGMTFYIIYSIGYFPLWIIGMCCPLGDFIAETAGAVIWMKFFVSIITVGVAAEMMKVATYCGIREENRKWLLFSFFSSLFVVLPVFQVGQYDVISLFFIMLGLRYYLEEKNWKFVLAFAFAIPMKYFALFIFIPLVLLKYKNFLKIIAELLAGMTFVLYEKIIYARLMPMIGNVLLGTAENTDNGIMLASETLTSGMIATNETVDAVYSGADMVSGQLGYALQNTVEIGNYHVSALALGFAILCIIAYIIKPFEDKKGFSQQAITVSFGSLVCFFLFFYSWNSYWIVLIAPFFLLYVFMYESNLRLNLLLETVITVGVVIGKMIHQSWVFGGQYSFTYGLLKDVPQRYMNVFYLVDKFKLNKYYSVIYAIVIVCVATIFIYNLWKNSRLCSAICKQDGQQEEVDNATISRGWWWLRLVILIVLITAELDVAFWE